jgi:hypothetical protein
MRRTPAGQNRARRGPRASTPAGQNRARRGPRVGGAAEAGGGKPTQAKSGLEWGTRRLKIGSQNPHPNVAKSATLRMGHPAKTVPVSPYLHKQLDVTCNFLQIDRATTLEHNRAHALGARFPPPPTPNFRSGF